MQVAKIVEANSGEYAEKGILQSSTLNPCTSVGLLFEANGEGIRKGILTQYHYLRTKEHARKIKTLVREHNLLDQKPIAIILYAKDFFTMGSKKNLATLENLLVELFPPDPKIQEMPYSVDQPYKISIDLDQFAIRFAK